MSMRMVGGSSGRIGVARRLRPWLVLLLVGLFGGLAAAPASAATLSLDISPDPTVDKSVTVTASGEAVNSRLWVFINWNHEPCAAARDNNPGYSLSTPGGMNGFVDVDGPFSHRYSFTPSSVRAHRLCAYVEDPWRINQATVVREVTPRAIQATVAVAVDPVVAAGQKVAVTVSGSSEVPRELEVWAQQGASCENSASRTAWLGWLSSDRDEKVDGPFSRTYSFTAGKYERRLICAAVGGDGYGRRADAIATGTVTFGNLDAEEEKPPADPPWLAAPANLLAPANGAVGLLLSPTFTWTSADVEHDILVLAYRKGKSFHPYMAVSRYGATWVSAKNLKSQRKLFDALEDPYARAEGWASLTAARAENTATVRFGKVIEPGRYRWTVYTGGKTGARTLVPSEQREFTVHGPALRSLQVRARNRPGRTAKSPGETALRISVTRYASVRVELRRGGRLSVQNYSAADGSKFTASVDWSCKKPGGRYRYRVIARDSHGKQLTRSGTFRPVSAARCRTMRKQEQRAKAARKRNADRRVAERRRAEAAAQQARIDRFKSNCRKLGGTPELIHSSDTSYWVCVSPWGGTWNVPY